MTAGEQLGDETWRVCPTPLGLQLKSVNLPNESDIELSLQSKKNNNNNKNQIRSILFWSKTQTSMGKTTTAQC